MPIIHFPPRDARITAVCNPDNEYMIGHHIVIDAIVTSGTLLNGKPKKDTGYRSTDGTYHDISNVEFIWEPNLSELLYG